jgi:ribosome-associated heat shock protein Hsp15
MSKTGSSKTNRPSGTAPEPAGAPAQRIDRFLWYTRLAHDRDAAQELAERGVVRLNGRRVERAHASVRPGDVLTLPKGAQVLVIRVLSLPPRRGPAPEARLCYALLDPDSP